MHQNFIFTTLPFYSSSKHSCAILTLEFFSKYMLYHHDFKLSKNAILSRVLHKNCKKKIHNLICCNKQFVQVTITGLTSVLEAKKFNTRLVLVKILILYTRHIGRTSEFLNLENKLDPLDYF